MNSDTISKFRLFGKAGKIVMTVLAVIAAIITISCCIAAAFVAALPDNALTVRVIENTELRFNAESFDTLWNIIGGNFSYSGESSPEYMLGEGAGKVTPPEDQQFKTELKLFNRSYDSAEIHSDGNMKVMQAEASPAEYNASDLTKVFIFAALFAASATVALWLLRGMFAVLTKCEPPFCNEVVAKMRGFGFSLLPVAVFASAAETMLESFFTAGKSTNVSIQWGILIAFVVTMALVAVFRYGVCLQKESDETL